MRFSSIVGGLLAVLPVFTAGLALSETTGQALNAFGKRSTLSDILTDIEDAATCTACNVRLKGMLLNMG
jgi:sphingomyelin phosphodiesterase